MKKLVSPTLILALALGFGLAALASAEEGTWSGWVTEDHCAAAGAKAAHKDCAIKCVKEKGGSPTDMLLTDRPLLIDVFLWALTVVLIVYTARGLPVPLGR